MRWARLKAVISLPQATFAPYGAGVKTSILFLEKRKQSLHNGNQLQIGQELIELDENYKVYMAGINDIGYDATGRTSLLIDINNNSIDVQETITDFLTCLGW